MVFWLQGCTFNCPGCFNPETHAMNGGQALDIDLLTARLKEHSTNLEGITISGGEPLLQISPLTRFLEIVRQTTSLSILVFTGFSWEEIQNLPEVDRFLMNVDVLLAGRYIHHLRTANSLIGSSNKTIHFLTKRYTLQDLDKVPPAEIVIAPDGSVRLTGINPLQWKEGNQ